MEARQTDGHTDEGIRELYRESALRTDMEWFTGRLRGRLAAERPARAAAAPPFGWRAQLLARPRRLALVALAGVVALGAVGYGVYAAVEHLSQQTPVLVIDDDSMLGSTGAASAYDAVLPPGVSAVVGTSGSSLWCLSRELGFTTLDAGAEPFFVSTGNAGDLVAYKTGDSGAGDVFVWDAAQTGADAGVTQLSAGDASQPITLLSMSPDGTKVAVARSGDVERLYIVDLITDSTTEWQWGRDAAPSLGGQLRGFVWSLASDAFYVSFELNLAAATELVFVGSAYLCDLTSATTTFLGDLGKVEAVGGAGSVAGLLFDYGPMGLASSAFPKASVAIWRDGQLETVAPVSQATFGPLSMSADGASVVLRGDDYPDSGSFGLEVIKRGDTGWTTAEVVIPPSLIGWAFLGFAGSDYFYFASGSEVQGGDASAHPRLGVLDPATGDYQMFQDLPIEGGSRLIGLWTQPSTPDEMPDEAPEDTSTTTSTTEPPSPDAPVTSTADLPLTEVNGTTVFSAAWGSGPGEFGVTRDDSWGLFVVAPSSFWVTPEGRLYILDPLNQRVQVVAADGTVEPAIPIDMGYPIDVAAASDGTVLVLGSDPDQGSSRLLQAYSPGGDMVAEYSAERDNANPIKFFADESTVYCEYWGLVGQDATDAGVWVTKYLPVYRDGEFFDPALGWDAAPYDQPLGRGLSLRSGDAGAEGRSEAQPIQNLHVFSGSSLAFSVDLAPSDHGPYTGVAAGSGEILVQSSWIVSDDAEGTRLANAVWAFSPAGGPLRRVEVLQSLHSAADSSGGCRSRLSPDGALHVLTTTSDRLSIVRYDVGAGGSESVTLPEQMPADFGFVARYGPGGFNFIDTIAGSCVKDLVDNGRVSAELRLTGAELQELYRSLVGMDVLGYPSYFQPGVDGTAVEGGSDYYLEVRFGGGVVKFLQWQDLFASSEPEAAALREWFATLQGMIEAKPEWQALPPAVGVRDG